MFIKNIFSFVLFVVWFYLREFYYFILRCRPMKEIKNEHVLITGSAQGIGAVFAIKFAQMNNTVHCVDVCEELNKNMVKELTSKGYKAFAYTCDLTDSKSIEQLGKEVKDNGGVVSYVVNNAGVTFTRKFLHLTPTQIEYTLKVNLLAQFLVTKLFLPDMIERDHGHIINMASMAGLFPLKCNTDYSASKAGSILFTEALAMELTETKINCTVVCPYFVNTTMIRGIEDMLTYVIQPDDLVDAVIRGVREGKAKIIVPRLFLLLALLKDVMPGPIKDKLRQFMIDDNTEDVATRYIGQRTGEKIK